MRKWVYNLEFPPWCPSIALFGYRFIRVEDYRDKITRLQHLVTVHSEFKIPANTGQHAITAYVEIPEHEEQAVLEWASKNNTPLNDILLLLSIFRGRNIFAIDDNDDNIGVITADPRQYQWGGVLRCSIPYREQQPVDLDFEFAYNIGFEEGLNRVYSLIRSDEWRTKYEGGYFLFLANQAFRHQTLESSFIQCWTIWEHLFTVHNRSWLSDNKIQQLEAAEKIAFILTEYALRGEIDDASRTRIKSLARIRNRLLHFGKFPDADSIHDDAILFIRLTEFILAKILDLSPSDVFNTMEKLEKFLHNIKAS